MLLFLVVVLISHMDVDMELFTKHLQCLMDEKTFSKKRLSETAGLETSTVRKILKGGNARIETIVKLSNALGLYPSEILPNEWQKPSEAVDATLLQQAISKALEFKAGLLKKGREVSEQQLATLVAATYVRMQNNESVENSDILQFINKKD